MRKNYYYLLLAVITIGCESTEDLVQESKSKKNPTQTYIINGDIEYISEITDGSKPKKPIFIYDTPNNLIKTQASRNKIAQNQEKTVISFDYGIVGSTKSGCFINRYNNGNSYDTDNGVYGYNPARQENGYLVRGAGLPHHNTYYGSLVLMCSNKGRQYSSRGGQIINDNLSSASAISIEYPFKANTTYEISLQTYFNDNKSLVGNGESNGFPTLYAQLKDSGLIIDGSEACKTDNLIRILEINPNNLKSYTLNNRIKEDKIIIFKFSLTEEKKALLLALNPKTGESGVGSPIPTNSYTMILPVITITEKAFDPSILVPIPPGRR